MNRLRLAWNALILRPTMINIHIRDGGIILDVNTKNAMFKNALIEQTPRRKLVAAKRRLYMKAGLA